MDITVKQSFNEWQVIVHDTVNKTCAYFNCVDEACARMLAAHMSAMAKSVIATTEACF